MEHVSKAISDFREKLGLEIYGRSLRECFEKGLCIECGEPAMPKCFTRASRQDYKYTCKCEICSTDPVSGK